MPNPSLYVRLVQPAEPAEEGDELKRVESSHAFSGRTGGAANVKSEPSSTYTVMFEGSTLIAQPSLLSSVDATGRTIEPPVEQHLPPSIRTPRLRSGARPRYLTHCSSIFVDHEASGALSRAGRSSTAATSRTTTDTAADGMERLISHVKDCLTHRHQITVINRGCQKIGKTDFSVRWLTHVLQRATPALEHALEIVADEAAKEKQMERLMSDESPSANKVTAELPAAAATTTTTGASPHRPSDFKRPEPPRRSFEGFTKTAELLQKVKMAQLRSASPRRRSVSPRRPSTARHRRYTLVNCTDRLPIDVNEPPVPLLTTGHDMTTPRPPSAGGGGPAHPFASSHRHHMTTMDVDALEEEADRTVDGQHAATTTSLGTRKLSGSSARSRKKSSIGLGPRRGSIRRLQRLTETPADINAKELRPPVRNGWRGQDTFTYYDFNGTDSYIALPSVPRFAFLVREFVVDFWMRVTANSTRQTVLYIGEGQRPETGMQFHVARNWYTDMGETMRVFLRDSGNRIFEAVFPVPTLMTHQWHHYQIMLLDVEEGNLKVNIDSEPVDRIRIMQSEQPNAWTHPWVSPLYLGGFVDDENNMLHPLSGNIVGLRFSKAATAEPVARWALTGHTTEGLKVISPDVPVKVNNCDLVDTRVEAAQQALDSADGSVPCDIGSDGIPKACPWFDGKTAVVNMGTLGNFGEFLHHFEIEIRFKTSEMRKVMHLVGVTDGQHKMAEIGLIMNAEPTLGADRYRFRERNMTVLLVDSAGRVASGLIRVNERQNLCDGRWNTILWKVVDAESNKMECKINGVTQEVLMMRRDGPRAFTALRDWICLGGHNARGYKLSNCFLGLIQHVQVTLRGEAVVRLDLNEGPGARIATDITGHAMHGLYVNPTTGMPAHNNVVWVPPHEEAVPDVIMGLEEEVQEVVLFNNNTVRYAVVVFTVQFDANGIPHEVMVDALHGGAEVEMILEPSVMADARFSLSDRGQRLYHRIPDSCFDIPESIGGLKENLLTAYENAVSQYDAHVAVVLGLGDARLTLLDIRGLRLPGSATYDSNMLKWKAPLALFTEDDKRTNILNKMVHGLDLVLQGVSALPSLVRRLPPENLSKKRTAEGILDFLTLHGIPSSLASFMHGSILNSDITSRLAEIHSLWDKSREDEVASMHHHQSALLRAAEEPAAVLVQRNWRVKVSRAQRMRLLAIRASQQQKFDEVNNIRLTDANVRPKTKLRAIIITCFKFRKGSFLRDIVKLQNDVVDVVRSFQSLGYEITRVEDPSKEELMEALERIAVQESTIVYIVGYGGRSELRRPVMPGWDRLVLQHDEGNARSDLEDTEQLRWNRFQAEFRVRAQAIAAADAAKGSAKKKKKKAPPARPATRAALAAQAAAEKKQEEAIRAFTDVLLQEEADVRFLLIREYDSFHLSMVTEHKRLVSQWHAFDCSFTGGKDILFTRECYDPHPFPSAVTMISDVELATTRKSKTLPRGFQCMLVVDLISVTRNAPGLAMLSTSPGHHVRYELPGSLDGVLTWNMRKAVQGYPNPIFQKKEEPILYGGVPCSSNERDGRSVAKYLAFKLEEALTRYNEKHVVPVTFESQLSKFHEELPYVADLVPLHRILATPEEKEFHRKTNDLKRVTANLYVGVDGTGVSYDMLADLRILLPEFHISDIVAQPALLLHLDDDNTTIADVSLHYIRDEIERCVVHGAVPIVTDVTPTSLGIRVDLAGGDRSTITQTMSALGSKSALWKIPMHSAKASQHFSETGSVLTTGIHAVETIHAVKGSSGNVRRWKQILRRFREMPQLSNSVRLLDCQAE